ncbi:MAG: phosphate ABC transporter permease PstA [Ilumatobacteraceae bacterium]
MAVIAAQLGDQRESLAAELRGISGRRRTKNTVMTVLMFLAVVFVGFALLMVLATVVTKGWSIVTGSFPKWFTKDIQLRPRVAGPGMKAAIVGTCVITFTATLIAVPLGIAGAVYLNEYGRTRLFARVLRFLANVMAGVPSIVMGLFIYVFWVVPRGTSGLVGFSGALALACLMLPIVVRSSEEMLRLVPQNLRDASYALGASTSRTTLRVVLPKASPGVISGCLLAVARAAGETAPLIFTIGAAKATNWNVLKGTNTSLSMQIYGNAKESFVTAQQRAWGAALTLIALAFLFTVAARLLSARLSRTR